MEPYISVNRQSAISSCPGRSHVPLFRVLEPIATYLLPLKSEMCRRCWISCSMGNSPWIPMLLAGWLSADGPGAEGY